MGMNLGLGFLFSAKDAASGTVRRLNAGLAGLEGQAVKTGAATRKAFVGLATGALILATGVGTLSGAFSLAGKAGAFEQGLAAVGAVSRATRQELALLKTTAVEAGIATQFSPTEAVEGLKSLATAGQTAVDATRTLIPVLDLAAGSLGQLGVAGSAEAVVGTLNAYGKTADHAAVVTDKLLRVTQLSNFQARDFETGLAKAAAAGATFGTSLDDTLITLGLLRNRNIEASSSATAFREALRRVAADQGAQEALMHAHVDVFDKATGATRSLVDIMHDTAIATADMTDKERNAIVVKAFGARGLLAFNAVQKAQTTVMRDGVAVTLRGADAIAHLRAEMAKSEGTAAKFRETLLNTFEGQKTLLRGTIETMGAVFGAPFARALKPFVTFFTNTLNKMIVVFRSLPDDVQDVVAKIVLGLGVFATVAGTVVTAVFAFALLKPFLGGFAIALKGVLGALLPVVATAAAAGIAIAVFRKAVRDNLGGIGDAVQRTKEVVSLAFKAVSQLFSQGGFSGEVRKELMKAENNGVRRFAISIFQIGHRISAFFGAVVSGFTRGLKIAEPVFGVLREAILQFGEAVGGLAGEEAKVASQTSTWVRAGRVAGHMLSGLVAIAAAVLVPIIRLTQGLIEMDPWLKAITFGVAAVALAVTAAASPWLVWAAAIMAVVFAVRQLMEWGDKLGGLLYTLTGGAEIPRAAGRGIDGRGGAQQAQPPSRPRGTGFPEMLGLQNGGIGRTPAPVASAQAMEAAVAASREQGVPLARFSREDIQELAKQNSAAVQKAIRGMSIKMSGDTVGEVVAERARRNAARSGGAPPPPGAGG